MRRGIIDMDLGSRVAILETQLHSFRENLVLQASEYERRLTELRQQQQKDRDEHWKYVSTGLGVVGGAIATVISHWIFK